MKFTYKGYMELISLLRECRYEIVSYTDWKDTRKCAVLRHDIDFDIAKSVRLAQVEAEGEIASTYFVMITSGFYNVFSRYACDGLKEILNCGHEIGLHFDEMRYSENGCSMDFIREKIQYEAKVLAGLIGQEVKTVSMHRPSKAILESDLKIDGMVNSYSKDYFREFKYLSDSRRRWREPVEETVKSGQFKRLHILTHAFWYHDEEKGLYESVSDFINNAGLDRYHILQKNITDIEEIMGTERDF